MEQDDRVTVYVWHRDFPETCAPHEEWPTTKGQLATDLFRLMEVYPCTEGYVFALEDGWR